LGGGAGGGCVGDELSRGFVVVSRVKVGRSRRRGLVVVVVVVLAVVV
jgi:hypothetical protein